MKLTELQKGVRVLAVVSTSIFVLLVSCHTYKNTKLGNSLEKNCGGYKTTGYTTKSETADKDLLHGEVRLCKTGEPIKNAHIYIKDSKDSLIADTYTDKDGKYSIRYHSKRGIGQIHVSSVGATLTIIDHDIGKYHRNTELNMRLYSVAAFTNDVPLTKEDIKAIEKNRK